MFKGNTKVMMVGVPKSLAKKIDDEIVNTMAYSNRQNYVEFAIRQYVGILDSMVPERMSIVNGIDRA